MAKKHDSRSAARRWVWLWAPLVLIVLTVAVCEWLAWPFLRGPVERGLERGLEREVELGDGFGVRFFGSLRAHTDLLAIGAPPDGPRLEDPGQARDFLRATRLSVNVPYSTVLGLWRPRPDAVLRVRSLEVDELDLTLLRTADGRANWQFGEKPTEPREEEAELPEFDRLVVQRARVEIDDAVTQLALQVALRTNEGGGTDAPGASAPASAASPASAARPAAAASPAAPAAAASAPPSPAADASVRGLEATAVGTYKKSKVRARLQTSGLLPLAAGGTEAQPLPLVIDLQVGETEAHVDGHARDLLALTALDGSFRLAGPSLSAVGDSIGMTLPTTAAFETNGRLRKEGETWQIAVQRLAVGTSRLQADLAFDRSTPVPSLKGSVGGARLALPDLAPAFGAPAQEKKKPAAAEGPRERVLPQNEFDLPSLAQMEADVELAFKEVDLGTDALEPFAPLNGRLRLKDSRLSVTGLLARNSGGELRGSLALNAKDQKRPVWNADLQWSGVRLERFVKAGEGRDTQEGGKAQSGYVGGVLSGRAKLEGRGRSTAQMLGSLDGSTEWWVSKGHMSHLLLEVAGIDIAEGLGLAIGGDEQLPVQCAVARTEFDDGLMAIDVGVIDTPDTTVLVTGSVALGREQLDLRLAASPKDFSPLTLRTPVRVEGTFAQPDVGLETKGLAVRALAGAALAAVVTPLAGLLALVDLGEEEKAVCQKAIQRLQSESAPPPPRRGASPQRK